MGNKNFKDLKIWQESKQLAVDVFALWKKVDNRGYFGLQDQMQRSAVSVPSNIAEGSERKSAKEYVRFLYIAKSSAAELRTQLYILSEIGICNNVDIDLSTLIDKCEIISRRVQRLISVICEGNK